LQLGPHNQWITTHSQDVVHLVKNDSLQYANVDTIRNICRIKRSDAYESATVTRLSPQDVQSKPWGMSREKTTTNEMVRRMAASCPTMESMMELSAMDETAMPRRMLAAWSTMPWRSHRATAANHSTRLCRDLQNPVGFETKQGDVEECITNN
jgi:hypothetical protein